MGARTYHEANYLKLDVSLSKQKLGWTILLNNEELIKKIVEWYKDFEKFGDAKAITNKQIQEYISLLQ